MKSESGKIIDNALRAAREQTASLTIYEILGSNELLLDSMTQIKLNEMAEEHQKRYKALIKKCKE